MSSERLRIVHVFRAPLGGLFRHVLDLAAEQSARGFMVGLFFDAGARDARVDQALARVAGGFALGVGGVPMRRGGAFGDFHVMARFRGYLGRRRPDVVHGHGAKGGLYARLSAWSAPPGRPIVAYTPHGGSFNHHAGKAEHRLYMAVERWLARSTDLFLFESAYIASRYDHYVGVETGLRRIVPNGLRPAEFTPVVADEDAADLVSIGELRFAKGIDTLIDALPLIDRLTGQRTRLALVGAGPDEAEFRARATKLGLADRVAFLGPLPAREAFRRGRIVVLASRHESLPYVVLEAAAAEAPLIATDVGGIPEIFGPYRDRLGPPDDPEGLARRIAGMMMRSAAARAEEARALKTYVALNFAISGMVEAVTAGYRDALARRRGAAFASPQFSPRG